MAKRILAYEEPREFQEILRLRRLRRRSYWRNIKPLFVNWALLFSLSILFCALIYRHDLRKVITPMPLLLSALMALSLSMIWRGIERRRAIQVELDQDEKGDYFLSRLNDFRNLPLKDVEIYVTETLKEDGYSCQVLVMKTREGEQRLVCLPDEKTQNSLEGKLRHLGAKKGRLNQRV